MAAKKKAKKFQGVVSTFDGKSSIKSAKFDDRSEAEKFVQRAMASDFIWVGDVYVSILHAIGEIKKV